MTTRPATPVSMVTAKALQLAVADLQETRPWRGLGKTVLMAGLTGAFGWLALAAAYDARWGGFVGLGALTGMFFASWLITTHDAIHHTFTGWRWFDEVVPRLMSWPIFWVHGMYSEVHKLHHKMNGDDLNDPERVQWTIEEYDAASPVGRFYARHQWALDLLLFAGIGMIAKTVGAAVRFYPQSKGVRRQVWLDLAGIGVIQTVIYATAAAYGMALEVFLFWLVLERIGGATLQWRSHVEHYGLWGKGRHYFETQVYACRNLRTNAFGSWFFNRLNFHSVHHAFPRVPFYLLGEAHRRFVALFAQPGVEPLTVDDSYVGMALRLAAQPTVIGPVDPESPRGRRNMVRI